MASSSQASIPDISKPFSYASGYPPLARTTEQYDRSETEISTSCRDLLVAAVMSSSRSFLRGGRITWHSGSPKRQLYSTTFGPSFVIINPTYRIPQYGEPSS